MWRTVLAVATLTLVGSTLSGQVAAEAEVLPNDTIVIPRDPQAYGCGADGYRFVVRGFDGEGSALDYVKRENARWRTEESWGELILVLGVSDHALWTLEFPMGSDACDDCSSPVLRETSFDGRRRAHRLLDGQRDDRSLSREELLDERLGTWGVLKNLRPVAYELNRDQPLKTGGLSSWLLRVRDAQHRKSYVWRHRTESMMCWCTSGFELSTYLWSE